MLALGEAGFCFLWAHKEGATSTIQCYVPIWTSTKAVSLVLGEGEPSLDYGVGIHSFHMLKLVVRHWNAVFCSDHVAECSSIFPVSVLALSSLKQSEQQSGMEIVISWRETWEPGRGPVLCLGSSLYK